MAERYYRKVIRLPAACSPNVRLALLQQAAGLEPTGETLVPGVVSWSDYKKRRATWSDQRQCVGLDAGWWDGEEQHLYPARWLNAAEAAHRALLGRKRTGRALGVDTAEGGDKTSLCAGDDLGVLALTAFKTPDTSVIESRVIAFAREWGVPPENWVFDRGGGGYEHACNLRARGFRGVRTVGFGESVALDPKRGIYTLDARKEVREERYVYVNRRAQMYHEAALLMDPDFRDDKGHPRPAYGLPTGTDAFRELRFQLESIPRLEDREGRIYLPPKNRKDAKDNTVCLVDVIGHSPDEADSFALMVHGLLHKGARSQAGVRG